MIVDEVDSMFIDDKRKSTVLNIHVPGMEYLVVSDVKHLMMWQFCRVSPHFD